MKTDKRKLKDQPWLYITLVTLLLLAIIGYLVVKKYLAP